MEATPQEEAEGVELALSAATHGTSHPLPALPSASPSSPSSSASSPPPPTLSSLTALLSTPDAVFHPDVLSHLRSFITLGGSPKTAIQLLSDSYLGRAEQINLLSHWLSLLPPPRPAASYTVDALHSLVLSSFSPSIADRVFSSLPSTPDWLLRVLAQPPWVAVLRDLARKHPTSLFLGFVERAVGQARGQGGREGTAELPLPAFEAQVEAAVSDAVEEAERGPGGAAQDALLQLGGSSEPAYLLTQSLLSSLSSPPSSLPPALQLVCRRLSEDLSLSVVSTHASPPSVVALDFLLMGAGRWPEVASALLPFYRGLAAVQPVALAQPLLAASLPSLTPSDAVRLYSAYASDAPPPTALLRSAPLLSSLVQSLFQTHSPLPRHQLVYLLCCATQGQGGRGRGGGMALSALIAALTALVELLASKTWALTPHQTLAQLRAATAHPLLSSVALHFLHRQLTSAAYYDSTSASSLTPQLLAVLGRVVSLSPLSHAAVLAVATEAFDAPTTLDSLALITLRKQLLHLLLHLVLCGHVEALRWVRRHVQAMDHSLTRQFCMGLVSGIDAPMSLTLVAELLALLTDDEVRKGMKVMMAVLALEVDKAKQLRPAGASPAERTPTPPAAPSGERVRKRLRRMEDEDTTGGGEMGTSEAAVAPAPAQEAAAVKRRRPVKTKVFLSDLALDGSGDEVEDVRALAAYLVELHSGLQRGAPPGELYRVDGGAVSRADVAAQLDGFFTALQPYLGLV